MATAPKPPARKAGKGEPPAAGVPSGATGHPTEQPDSNDKTPMFFRVPSTFQKDFKMAAVMTDKTMTQVLEEAFELYKAHHGLK